MDYLLSFFFLIIASIIGISISLLLNIKSYLKIAILVVCIFIPIELYNDLVVTKKRKQIPNPNSQPNSLANTLANTIPSTTTLSSQTTQDQQSNVKFAREQDLENTKYGIFKRQSKSNNEEKDSLPLDGLDPQTLLSKLNYIEYATSNPYKPITYTEFKTHADKYLDQDGTKLSAQEIDPRLLAFSKANYPQLTSDQIDARDCLNYGSDPSKSCFQSAQLFHNILNKGVNNDNANLIIKEDFSNPMMLNHLSNNQHVLFKNAPSGNQDIDLNSQSNETIQLEDNSMATCRNCKLAVCKSDYCGLQNQLFM
jgi:hypothetical protein